MVTKLERTTPWGSPRSEVLVVVEVEEVREPYPSLFARRGVRSHYEGLNNKVPFQTKIFARRRGHEPFPVHRPFVRERAGVAVGWRAEKEGDEQRELLPEVADYFVPLRFVVVDRGLRAYGVAAVEKEVVDGVPALVLGDVSHEVFWREGCSGPVLPTLLKEVFRLGDCRAQGDEVLKAVRLSAEVFLV
jgi:hypothetical protein